MATTTFTFYTVSWQGQDGISAPGLAVPLPDAGDGAVGTSTSFARQDHVHPLVVEEIGVGSTANDLIQPIASGMQLISAYARKQGDIVVFSFAATLSDALSYGETLFQIDESLAPGPATNPGIDFIILDGSGKGQFGHLETIVFYHPAPTPTDVYGVITNLSALPAGTIRGELVWMVEPVEVEE